MVRQDPSRDHGWTERDVPRQDGKTFIVTGANSGVGFETCRVLASRGASVVMASRDVTRGDAARKRILETTPAAACEVMKLDLASLASVRSFAQAYLASHRTLDVLVCNAGVMAIPHAGTEDGFEMQLGTNHLGHFALTGLLLPILLERPEGRVVIVSSDVHRAGSIELLDDPFFEKRSYTPWRAYAQSKLANLLFMCELARRLHSAAQTQKSIGAHPGYAATALQLRGPRLAGRKVLGWLMAVSNAVFAQSAAAGAWPLLRAATDPDARSGDYFGPSRLRGMRGPAVRVKPSAVAQDQEAARKLWEFSERITGVTYSVG